MEKFWLNLPVLISHGMYREIVEEAESFINKLESYKSEEKSIQVRNTYLKEIKLVKAIKSHAKYNS